MGNATSEGWSEGGQYKWGNQNFLPKQERVRQEDPVSPLLFNLITDALATILEGAKHAGHLGEVAAMVVPGGLTILYYADDTLIFIKNSPEAIINIKFLLMCFEAMSGLKINFEKSETIFTGGDLESQLRASNMMNCKLGTIPMNYLGC